MEKLDKCFICGFVAPSESFNEDEDGCEYCPQCGSYDIDDAGADAYEEEDDEDYWSGVM